MHILAVPVVIGRSKRNGANEGTGRRRAGTESFPPSAMVGTTPCRPVSIPIGSYGGACWTIYTRLYTCAWLLNSNSVASDTVTPQSSPLCLTSTTLTFSFHELLCWTKTTSSQRSVAHRPSLMSHTESRNTPAAALKSFSAKGCWPFEPKVLSVLSSSYWRILFFWLSHCSDLSSPSSWWGRSMLHYAAKPLEWQSGTSTIQQTTRLLSTVIVTPLQLYDYHYY